MQVFLVKFISKEAQNSNIAASLLPPFWTVRIQHVQLGSFFVSSFRLRNFIQMASAKPLNYHWAMAALKPNHFEPKMHQTPKWKHWRQLSGQLLGKTWRMPSYTCQLFFSKLREIFRLHRTWISEGIPTASENCWNFRKTSEDRQRFSMTSEDCRSFPTTSEDERDERFSTTSKQGAPMIFKGFLTNPEHYERVLKMFWRLLERF